MPAFFLMSARFFTADFHFGMGILLDQKAMNGHARPFKTTAEMNAAFLDQCLHRAKVYLDSDGHIIDRDIIIHAGDLASFKSDRGQAGITCSPASMIAPIQATFINIKGNHDPYNNVKSVCESMRTKLGSFSHAVSISHYPTYDPRAEGHFREFDIHLCGHVHFLWKHCFDLDHNCLNINVGVDVWNWKIVSEKELSDYISSVMKRINEDESSVCRVKKSKTGKLVFQGNPF